MHPLAADMSHQLHKNKEKTSSGRMRVLLKRETFGKCKKEFCWRRKAVEAEKGKIASAKVNWPATQVGIGQLWKI